MVMGRGREAMAVLTQAAKMNGRRLPPELVLPSFHHKDQVRAGTRALATYLAVARGAACVSAATAGSTLCGAAGCLARPDMLAWPRLSLSWLSSRAVTSHPPLSFRFVRLVGQDILARRASRTRDELGHVGHVDAGSRGRLLPHVASGGGLGGGEGGASAEDSDNAPLLRGRSPGAGVLLDEARGRVLRGC